MENIEEKIGKLPKWVQKHIKDISIERSTAIKALNEFIDNQTESPVWYDDLICTGEEQGPSFKKKYIQTRSITFEYAGVSLRVLLRDNQLDLSWSAGDRFSSKEAAFIPTSYMQARIVAKENMD